MAGKKIKLVPIGEENETQQTGREAAQSAGTKNRIKLVSDGTRDWANSGTKAKPVVTEARKQEAENLYQRFIREAREKKTEAKALEDWIPKTTRRGILDSMEEKKIPVSERIDVAAKKGALKREAEKEAEKNMSWGNIFAKAGMAPDTTAPASGFTAMEQGIKETEKQRRYQSYIREIEKNDFMEKIQMAFQDPDFAKKSEPKELWKPDERYNYINNLDNARAKENLHISMGGAESPYRRYDAMTEQEIRLYNYLYATEGKESADRYLDNMADSFAIRLAETNAPEGTTAQILSGLPAGVAQFGTGMQQIFSTDPVPVGIPEAYGQVNREKLAGKGPMVLGQSLGQAAFDAAQIAGNQIVPMTLNLATGGGNIGTILMGTSAGGNAYREKLKEGWSTDQALTYGVAIGALEGYLQNALGGISAFGGTSKWISKKVAGMQNAVARFALRYGGSMASEGLEEGLQEVLGPVVESIITRDDLEPARAENIMYAALLGALSAGILEAPGLVAENLPGRNRQGQTETEQMAEQGPVQTQEQPGAAEQTETTDSGLALTMPEELRQDTDWIVQQEKEDRKNGQKNSGAREDIRKLGEDYVAGRITDEQFDEAVKDIMRQEIQERMRETGADNTTKPTEGTGSRQSAPVSENSIPQSNTESNRGTYEGRDDTGLTLTMPEELRQESDWIVQQEKQRGRNAAELTQQKGQNQAENRDSSGFVNMSRRELSDSDSAYLNTLAKAAGVTVRMVEREGTPQQGWYENGQVFIRSDAADPGREVVKHEITHLMQEEAPEAYQEYLDAVRKIYQERGTLDSAVAELRELYRSNHVNLTEEQAMDELAADFAGELTENEAVIRKLAGETPSLGRRILDTIRQLLGKIRNAVGRKTADPETRRLERAARLWETALEAVGTRENQSGELRQEQERDMMAQTNNAEQNQEANGIDSREALTEEESGALLNYKSSGSYKLNSAIRDGLPMDEQTKREIAALDSALEKLPVYQGTVYRRLNFDLEGQEALYSFLGEHVLGKMIQYPAYTSTSTSPTGYPVEGELTATIIIDSKNGKDVDGHGNNFESEIIFPRLSKFVINRAEIDTNGKPVIYMEEVLENGAGQLYSQERGQTVQQMQEKESGEAVYMRGVSGLDPGRNADGRLPGLRTGRGTAETAGRMGSENQGDSGQYGGQQQKTAEGETGESLSGESGTRYSMEGSRDLLQQIEILQKQNKRLKEEMKRTDVPRMNRSAVEKQAGDMLKAYSSRYNKSKLSDQLEGLYNGIADRTMLESDMRDTAREIADSIIKESQAQVNPLYEEYADLRKTLRETKLYLQEEYRGDLTRLGYEEIRKNNMGRLRLANEGTPVESMYDSLSEKHPDLFPDDIYHPAEQLERIVDVAGQLQKVMDNPYEGTKAAEYLANDILERYYDTETRKPTFADRQYAKRQQDKAALKGKYQGKAAQARERAKLQEQMYYSRILHEKQQKQTQQIKEIRQRYRDANRAMSERRTETQLRDTIARHANKLAGKLLRPNDKQHIPEHLRGSVLDLLRSIDIGSNYTVNMATGERIRLDNMAEFQQMGLSTKRSEAALRLKESYEKLESDEGASMVIDPDLLDTLTEVALLGETRLADMNRKQLTTLWNAVKAVESSIQTADKMLTESRYQTISEAANALEEANWEKHRKPRFIGTRQLDNLLNLDMLAPETFFHKLGKPGEEMYHQLRQAKDRETEILSEMVDKSQKIFRDSGLDPYKLEKEVKEFTLSTKDKNGKPEKITMTTAQIMELYNLSRRKQAVKHLYEGGIRPDTVQKGVREIWRPAAVNITPDDMGKIINTLTPEQKALADSMRKELSTTVAGYGNEASMAAYGYEKFKEKDYWPIKVDKGSTKTDPAAEAKSKTIPGYGMTKATVPKANNPVGIHSVFDTYSQHISQMATYAAWLTASQDVQRIHNFKFDTGDGTVKNLFDQVYGEGGNRYFEKLMQDIAAGTKAVGDTEFSMDAAISNFKASAVGWNMRVILQQPTAILRAAEMIDMKYLAAGMAKKSGWGKALQYAPIAKWKDWGYFEIGTGKSLKELMLGPGSKMEKVRGKSMELAGKMDSVAWGALWNAVELEIQDKKPELRKGSQEYYKECADRFSEIIDRTQVVDSVLHRTQAMRSQNHLYKMATSFMSEPSKVYNQVARGVYDLTSAGTKEERTTAGKKLAGTALALTLSFAANAVSQSLSDTWRDDDEEKELDEKFAEHWKENFLQNYNPIGYVPFLKDIASIWEGYDVSRMDMEAISSLVDAAKNLQKSMDGTGKNTEGYAGFEMALEACRALGLPVANIKRDVLGIVSTALNEMGLYKEAYEMDKLMYSIDNEANRSQFVGNLYLAMDENWEDYEEIYQDLLKEGMEEADIKSSMESRMKKALGVESVKSLPMRYHAPGEDEAFDNFMLEAEKSGKDWTDLLPDGSQEMAMLLEENKDAGKLERFDAIATSPWDETIKESAMENQMGDSDYKKYMAAREAGVSTLQYVDFLQDAYLNAQKRTSKDDASPSQEDVKNALNSTNLSRSQKRAIWKSYGWKADSPW